MLNWIMKAFYPLKYQSPQKREDPLFEFEIGETVAVYDGWEVPLFYGVVQDRSIYRWVLRHPSGDTSSYAEARYLVSGKEYGRRALKKVESKN